MRRFAGLFLALLIALAPAFADARPGGGGSFGSRGGHTYLAPPSTNSAPFGAAPMQRSLTPNNPGGYGGSSYGSNYGSNYGGGYGMRPRSAFASGLFGGLLGAGIGGMLFGRGFFGGLSGGGSLLGLVLQLFLLYLIGSWLYRRFFMGRVAVAGGGPGLFSRMMPGGGMGAAPMSARAPQGRPIQLVQTDYQAFDALLHNIQRAWSAHDLNALGTMATPEMVSYFAEQLAEQTSRGVRNICTDVRLMKGDLSEAWSEGPREYATVSMQFSMIDVTRDAAGRVVDGSPNERVTVTEIWTFLRAPGGRWVLSAIQQAR
jgi:predicted lipid-binding transport protein (Tim44 family)